MLTLTLTSNPLSATPHLIDVGGRRHSLGGEQDGCYHRAFRPTDHAQQV